MKTSILIAAFVAVVAATPALAAKGGLGGTPCSTSDGTQAGNDAVIAARNGIRLAEAAENVRTADAVESVRNSSPAGRIFTAEAAENVRTAEAAEGVRAA